MSEPDSDERARWEAVKTRRLVNKTGTGGEEGQAGKPGGKGVRKTNTQQGNGKGGGLQMCVVCDKKKIDGI